MKADFGKILSEAFKITLRNKWLWVFGLVIATLSSGSSSNFSNYSRLFNSSSNDKNKQERKVEDLLKDRNFQTQPTELFNETGRVLGEASVSLKNLISTLPFYYYILLVFFLLLTVVFGVAITLYAREWASGSLIHGIDLEAAGTMATLSALSKTGRSNAVEMIKLSFIPSMATLLIFSVIFIPEFILFVMVPGFIKVLVGLVLFITFLLCVLVFIVVLASVMLGSIALILEGLNWRDALSKGYFIFKKFFLDVVVMGVINCFLGGVLGVVSCIVVIPLVLIGIAGFAGVMAAPPLAIIIFPIGALIFIAVVLVTALVQGVSVVFMEATWVLLYKQLVGTTTVVGGLPAIPQSQAAVTEGEVVGGVS